MKKVLYFRIEDLDGVGQVWYCKTVEYKNKIIDRLDKLGHGYTVTRVHK
jgi:hypothetical protein